MEEENIQLPPMAALGLSSVEYIPQMKAAVAFVQDASKVFREDVDIVPRIVDKETSYMPWGADNMMPYNVLDLIEKDETLTTCQIFNAEVAYGSGLRYEPVDRDGGNEKTEAEIAEFFEDNDISSYYLGLWQDFKYFGFAVSVIILSADRTRIVRVARKEACYCRFAPVDQRGRIPYVLYANWRTLSGSAKNMEKITLLDPVAPLPDLRRLLKEGKEGKFAVVSRIPTPDSSYYPIPYYAALFKGKWYNIKQLIGTAKEAKMRNTAPISYHVEVSSKYWTELLKREGITDIAKGQERIREEKQRIIDFLTGVENSGKAWFSTVYQTPDGRELPEIRISKIDTAKAGGDFETDIQEAINMICFTMRVHSNLVGSVPGKAQSNNSGSDKRELYTIAQALQKPYRDILFGVHRMIISFNGWKGYRPASPFMQLTTLDQHSDIRQINVN